MNSQITLADFIALILSQTLDGVITSEMDSIEKIAQLKNTVNLSDEVFAEKYITPWQIREQILILFPTDIKEVSAIDAGQPYEAATDTQFESPPIFELLEYTMSQEDYQKVDSGCQITPQGYEHLYLAVKKIYISNQRQVIKQLLYKGIPNLYVDHGEITSKLSFDSINILEQLTESYVSGLIYKCYKQWEPDSDVLEGLIPYKTGVCKHFNVVEEAFNGAEMMVFEGIIRIPYTERYKLELLSSPYCLVWIDDLNVLSNYHTNGEHAVIHLSKGFHKFQLVCNYSALSSCIYLGYGVSYSEIMQEVSSSMLYHLPEDNRKTPFSYKTKKGEVIVSMQESNVQAASSQGEIKLFYRITHD